jgi:hypothetical protein
LVRLGKLKAELHPAAYLPSQVLLEAARSFVW